MTIRKAETFRDWTISLNTEEVYELMYALDAAIQRYSKQDDFISKSHTDSFKHMLDVLNNKN